MKNEYLMGTSIGLSIRKKPAQQLTFIVTKDCNLACKYCYMHYKNNKSKMSIETAKAAIDLFLDEKRNNYIDAEYIILEFIGGEPLLEIDLIDQVVDYFKISAYRKNSKWFGKYRISIGSNGVLYDNARVQRFIKKNYNMLSIGITIDGTKEKHDLQRVFPDNSGSYNVVRKNVDLLLQQYPKTITKVTISHDDLSYIKESIIHLWEIGLKEVPANVVFEDVWKDGDSAIFEQQLIELADYVIENKLWSSVNTSLFSENIGYKQKDNELNRAVCGTGRMFSVDANGDIYSCVRFAEYSLQNKPAICFGSIYTGIDEDKLRAFQVMTTKYLSPPKCINCRINTECIYCAGFNYDASTKDTLFDRALFICDMHKARVRANRYYWAKLYNNYGIRQETFHKPEYFMFFILAENSISFCNYASKDNCRDTMTVQTIIEGLEYAYQNFYHPVFVHSRETEKVLQKWIKEYEQLRNSLDKHIIRHIMPYSDEAEYNCDDTIFVFSAQEVLSDNFVMENKGKTAVLTISDSDLELLANSTRILLKYFNRVNINYILSNKEFNLDEYDEQLKQISKDLCDYTQRGIRKEVNKLTDRIYLNQMNNCFSGEKNITYGVDGKLYICPAFYYANQSFGDLHNGPEGYIIHQTALKSSPICAECDAYQCNRCVYLNKERTGEHNVSPKLQCVLSHIERENSRLLMDKVETHIDCELRIPTIDYNDPIVKVLRKTRGIDVCHK